MNNFKQRIKNILFRIYRNSYGFDELNKTLLWSAVITSFLSLLFKNFVLTTITYACDILFLFRFFSKKKFARSEENRKFRKVKKFVSVYWTNRKTHKVFTCHKCGQIIRVPKGKGKIEVTCPNCKIVIETRS